MTDVYSSHSERLQDNDAIGSDFDSSYLKSPNSGSDSGSLEPESSLGSPSHGQSSLPISRPLSRSSVTSGLSVTATKDGVEGKRVKRAGIPGYPLSLINKMYSNYAKQHRLDIDQDDRDSQDDADELMSAQSIKSASSLIPQYDPYDRDADRGSMMSGEFYDEQDMDAPRNFELNYDGPIHRDAEGQVVAAPQISIDSDSESSYPRHGGY